VAGVARRITGRDHDGVAFDILIPRPIADDVVPVRLEAVEAALRELDALATGRPGARSLVRSLLAAECLPGREVMALAAGAAVRPSASTDRAVRRFEQACRDGARSGAVDVAMVRRAHRRLVPGGGATRGGLVWIGAVRSPAGAAFVPPPPGEIDRLLSDLVAFLGRDDLCPVAKTAIAFAQLEFIHPFADGNGRLGRWLVQVTLRHSGVARNLVPPLGLYLASNPDAFAAAHQDYRDGALDRWCEFAARALMAVTATARQLLQKRPEPTSSARGAVPNSKS
jgi:hypothetical protein